MDRNTADRLLEHVDSVRILQLERLKLQREHELDVQGKTMRLHSAGLVMRAAAFPADTPEAMRERAAQYRGIVRSYLAMTLATREPDAQVAATVAQQITELIQTAAMWEARARKEEGPPRERVHGCDHHDAAPADLVVCMHGMTCARCFRSFCQIGQLIASAERGRNDVARVACGI